MRDRCPLCDGEATLEWKDEARHCVVTCGHCTTFTGSAEFMAECRTARANGRLEILSALSDHAAKTRAQGGNLNLDVDQVKPKAPPVFMTHIDGKEAFQINHPWYLSFHQDPEKAGRTGYVTSSAIACFDEAGTRDQLWKFFGLASSEIDAMLDRARKSPVPLE